VPPAAEYKIKNPMHEIRTKGKKISRATELISDIRCDEIPAESAPSKTPEHLKRGRRPDSYEATVKQWGGKHKPDHPIKTVILGTPRPLEGVEWSE